MKRKAPMLLHRSLHYRRTTYPGGSALREKAFAEAWEAHCASANYRAPLEVLLQVPEKNPARAREQWNFSTFSVAMRTVYPVGQREATIAATLIQWLGTNIGFYFLENALKACGYKIVRIGDQ